MAADQQFCLRWNNHQSTLISVFDTLLENGTLVDCTLAAEGQYLKAHKVVLSACSPYMETLLSQNYDKHPILILKDVKFTELKSMMDYMYRGEVNISQDQLGTFLKAAESLQIKGLSENGEGDARDVGSTNTNPPPPRRPPATRPEPEAAQSPAHRSRDGSVSPSSRKRRRLRRNSDDGDNHIESNSCDVPAQSTPVPNIPASITTTPIRTPIVKPEVNDRLDHNTLPAESGLLKEKIEPAEPLLEPKTEYLEDLNNDDSVEDLTLDDDDEMDMSQMSNLSNMSRPGPSHGADLSNQGFPPWQLGNQSGTDEVFMAAQEAVNAHRDSQEGLRKTAKLDVGLSSQISARRSLSEENTPKDPADAVQKDIIFNERLRKFQCKKCAKTYVNHSRVVNHLLNSQCEESKSFRCDLCPYSAQKELTLRVHRARDHMVIDQNREDQRATGLNKVQMKAVINAVECCEIVEVKVPEDERPYPVGLFAAKTVSDGVLMDEDSNASEEKPGMSGDSCKNVEDVKVGEKNEDDDKINPSADESSDSDWEESGNKFKPKRSTTTDRRQAGNVNKAKMIENCSMSSVNQVRVCGSEKVFYFDEHTNAFTCKTCKKTFTSSLRAEKHKNTVCSGKVNNMYQCSFCAYTSKAAAVVRVHMGKKHGKWLKLDKNGAWVC